MSPPATMVKVEPAKNLFSDYPADVLARYKVFHTENPHVFTEFRKYAARMRDTGKLKYSARTIVEVMRWNFDLKTKGDVFEINGDFVPIMVRLLIHQDSSYANFFELRKVRSRGIKSIEQIEREEETF